MIGVEPFRDLTQTALSAAFAEGLSERIAHAIVRRGLYSVNASESRHTPDCLTSQQPEFYFEGSIREVEGGLSVLMTLVRADPM